MKIEDLLMQVERMGGSDLHIQSGNVPRLRVEGKMRKLDMVPLNNNIVNRIRDQMDLSDEIEARYIDNNTVDFKYVHDTLGTYRVNISACWGGVKVTMRKIDNKVRTCTQLGFREDLFDYLSSLENGMVIFTGPTGCGKSSSLASLLKHDDDGEKYIITFEDPIEFELNDTNNLITQNQLYRDFSDYPSAITRAMRQDPDIIMVGEMRGIDTMRAGVTAAETGHLVLSTLHTKDIESSYHRMFGVFKPEEQHYIKTLLDDVIRCIVSQRLVFNKELGRRELVYEYKIYND